MKILFASVYKKSSGKEKKQKSLLFKQKCKYWINCIKVLKNAWIILKSYFTA